MQCLVPSSLHYFGPNEALFQLLQASLHRHTRSFAHYLIDTITQAQWRGPTSNGPGGVAGEWEDSPSMVPGPDATQGDLIGQPSRGPSSRSHSVSIPTHREQEGA